MSTTFGIAQRGQLLQRVWAFGQPAELAGRSFFSNHN